MMRRSRRTGCVWRAQRANLGFKLAVAGRLRHNELLQISATRFEEKVHLDKWRRVAHRM
jgi:hypothetical protein